MTLYYNSRSYEYSNETNEGATIQPTSEFYWWNHVTEELFSIVPLLQRLISAHARTMESVISTHLSQS